MQTDHKDTPIALPERNTDWFLYGQTKRRAIRISDALWNFFVCKNCTLIVLILSQLPWKSKLQSCLLYRKKKVNYLHQLFDQCSIYNVPHRYLLLIFEPTVLIIKMFLKWSVKIIPLISILHLSSAETLNCVFYIWSWVGKLSDLNDVQIR